MSDLAGKRLGDFHIDALVGRGSMARVYKAWQTSLRRPVALKVLKEEIFTPGDRVKRFLREAEALARLEHPHIVPVYAAGEAAPYYYFAMRYVGGGTLAESMQHGIEQSRALEWIRQVCRALAYAHEAGVVHRDLKPTNVLIQGESALLADFGLARLRDLSTLTQSGMVLGTPLYMAPEQTLGEAISPATDCFALGVLCYQILTGEHPFTDLRKTRPSPRDQTDLFDRIQRAEARALRELDPGIPSELEAVVLKALARRPADRFATATDLLQALDSLEGLFSALKREVKSLPAEPHRREPEPERASPILHAETKELPHAAAKPPGESGKSTFCFGRYELLGELGHGGQGVVYRARDTILGREVALKVLQGGWKASPRLVELFRREAQIAAGLSHPHIIQVLDFGLEDESPYVTMPVIEGQSLDRLISRGSSLPIKFSILVLLQTAEALAYAHDAGVLHLDVKPGNILLQRPHRRRARAGGPSLDGLAHPHVVLTDFTMAKLRTQPEHDDSSFITSGTVPYASPEQLANDLAQLSPASDLFSLGVILHEMLTGKRLFAGDDPSVDKMLVLHASIPPPSARSPEVPPELDALCLRLLRRAPGERFASADALIESVESLGLSR